MRTLRGQMFAPAAHRAYPGRVNARIRTALLTLAAALAVLVLLAGALLVPAVQRRVAQWLLSGPGQEVQIQSLSARPSGLECQGLRLRRPGLDLSLERVSIAGDLLAAAFGTQLRLERVELVGLEARLTDASAGAIQPAQATGAVAVGALLEAVRLPRPLAIEQLKASGAVSGAAGDRVSFRLQGALPQGRPVALFAAGEWLRDGAEPVPWQAEATLHPGAQPGIWQRAGLQLSAVGLGDLGYAAPTAWRGSVEVEATDSGESLRLRAGPRAADDEAWLKADALFDAASGTWQGQASLNIASGEIPPLGGAEAKWLLGIGSQWQFVLRPARGTWELGGGLSIDASARSSGAAVRLPQGPFVLEGKLQARGDPHRATLYPLEVTLRPRSGRAVARLSAQRPLGIDRQGKVLAESLGRDPLLSLRLESLPLSSLASWLPSGWSLPSGVCSGRVDLSAQVGGQGWATGEPLRFASVDLRQGEAAWLAGADAELAGSLFIEDSTGKWTLGPARLEVGAGSAAQERRSIRIDIVDTLVWDAAGLVTPGAEWARLNLRRWKIPRTGVSGWSLPQGAEVGGELSLSGPPGAQVASCVQTLTASVPWVVADGRTVASGLGATLQGRLTRQIEGWSLAQGRVQLQLPRPRGPAGARILALDAQLGGRLLLPSEPGAKAGLEAELKLGKVDAGAWLTQADTAVPPVLEGIFSGSCSASAQAATAEGLLDAVVLKGKLQGGPGILRALQAARPEAELIATGAQILGALLGADQTAAGVGELAAALREIPYDQLQVGLERRQDQRLALAPLLLSGPEIRLEGEGASDPSPLLVTLRAPLRLELRLAGRERLGRLLQRNHWSGGPADAEGFVPLFRPLQLGGCLAELDGSDATALMREAAARSVTVGR